MYEIGLDGKPVRLQSLAGPSGNHKPAPAAIAPVTVDTDGAGKQAVRDSITFASLLEVVSDPHSPLQPQEIWTEAAEAIVAPLFGARIEEFKQFVLKGKPSQPKRGENPLKPTFITGVSFLIA